MPSQSLVRLQFDVMMVPPPESVNFKDYGRLTFKYLGVVLDDTLSFNDHVDYVRMKVSKILGMFSRIRPSLTTRSKLKWVFPKYKIPS